MHRVALHTQAVADNRAFVERVLARSAPEDYGWGVTGAFYMALHVSRAYFACRGHSVATHVEGETMMQAFTELKTAIAPLKTLKEISENARYYNLPMTEKNLRDALSAAIRVDNIISPQTRRRCQIKAKAPAP